MAEYTITANGLTWPGQKTHGPPERAQVEEAKRFIGEWSESTKTIRQSRTSYGLKHAAETWSYERQKEGVAEACGYISNGALIQAAAELGVQMKPIRPGSPNVFFALSWKRLERERERPAVRGYQRPRRVRRR